MNNNITFRNNKPLNTYFEDINKHPLLTNQQQMELVQRVKEGDEEALRMLVDGNIRIVASIAKQYLNKGKSLEELIEAGNKGLAWAAQKYNPDSEVRFISYAMQTIRVNIVTIISIKSKK